MIHWVFTCGLITMVKFRLAVRIEPTKVTMGHNWLGNFHLSCSTHILYSTLLQDSWETEKLSVPVESMPPCLHLSPLMYITWLHSNKLSSVIHKVPCPQKLDMLPKVSTVDPVCLSIKLWSKFSNHAYIMRYTKFSTMGFKARQAHVITQICIPKKHSLETHHAMIILQKNLHNSNRQMSCQFPARPKTNTTVRTRAVCEC
jgi:hypothetical protein